MVVTLSVFDSKLGPIAAIIVPESFDEKMANENAKALDIQSFPTEFVVKEYPAQGLKSINLQFDVPSTISRGRTLNLQLSAFISETYPAEKLVRSKLVECKDKLLADPESFLAFYTNHESNGIRYPAIEKRKELVNLMKWLDSEIKVSMPVTSAVVMGKSTAMGALSFPVDFQATAGNIASPDVLVIYRKDGDGSITVKVLPSTPRVMKVRVIAENFTPKLMMALMDCAKNLKLIYTTGLCQETTGKCLHETYFAIEGDGVSDKREISGKLATFSFVKQYDVDVIETSRR
jgi:hypothetical protein